MRVSRSVDAASDAVCVQGLKTRRRGGRICIGVPCHGQIPFVLWYDDNV